MKKKDLHKIISFLLIFLMIFQIVPKRALADTYSFYMAYDSAGAKPITITPDGDVNGRPNYYVEIDESVTEIYMKFETEFWVYHIINDYYIEWNPNQWTKVDLNQFPFWDEHADIGGDDPNRYRSLALA
ncbi:MAG TPA: hypothetical protein DC038_10080, partial [Clostridiales bacterium]|nr:hypothetical protein [Clostridiales bacterium]